MVAMKVCQSPSEPRENVSVQVSPSVSRCANGPLSSQTQIPRRYLAMGKTISQERKIEENQEGMSDPAKASDRVSKEDGFLICSKCGNRLVPSRTSEIEPPVCGDTVLHLKIDNQSRVVSGPRCLFCSGPLPPGSRKSRVYCKDSCRVMDCGKRKAEDRETSGGEPIGG
jgi:hypothetical protein